MRIASEKAFYIYMPMFIHISKQNKHIHAKHIVINLSTK